MSPRVRQYITKMASEENGNAAIARSLGQLALDRKISPEEVPSKSTIDRTVRQLKVNDSSGPWLFATANPEEAALVLDVVAKVVTFTRGRTLLSKNHVAEIARLRKAVPNIPAMWAYNLARAYLLCREHERDSRHLDFALGVRPWEGALSADQLARALGEPRSFRVDQFGALDYRDSLSLLFALVAFQGTIEEMGSRVSPEGYVALPPPEITVVESLGPWEYVGEPQLGTAPMTDDEHRQSPAAQSSTGVKPDASNPSSAERALWEHAQAHVAEE